MLLLDGFGGRLLYRLMSYTPSISPPSPKSTVSCIPKSALTAECATASLMSAPCSRKQQCWLIVLSVPSEAMK